jgi:hypothetical protein
LQSWVEIAYTLIGTRGESTSAVEFHSRCLPVEILRAGVRIFEAGFHGELAQGREESRGTKRRQMRLQRRRTDRRRRRLKKVSGLAFCRVNKKFVGS